MSRFFGTVLSVAMCLGGSVWAHPHVFVDARTGFIFNEDGELAALRISWTYDEFTTLVLFETLHLDGGGDGDGLLSNSDRAAIIEGETAWAPDYKGDIYLEFAGKDYPLGRPEAAEVTYEDYRVEVSFELPLLQPVPVEVGSFVVLRLYDPTFYYDYSILPAPDLADIPDGCEAQIVPFEPDNTERVLQERLAALSRDDAPAQQNVGRLFSDEVHLICG